MLALTTSDCGGLPKVLPPEWDGYCSTITFVILCMFALEWVGNSLFKKKCECQVYLAIIDYQKCECAHAHTFRVGRKLALQEEM